jgi:hypothetical protein
VPWLCATATTTTPSTAATTTRASASAVDQFVGVAHAEVRVLAVVRHQRFVLAKPYANHHRLSPVLGCDKIAIHCRLVFFFYITTVTIVTTITAVVTTITVLTIIAIIAAVSPRYIVLRSLERTGNDTVWIDAAAFRFAAPGGEPANNTALAAAFDRFSIVCFGSHRSLAPPSTSGGGEGGNGGGGGGVVPLSGLVVTVRDKLTPLVLGVDESYNLTISHSQVRQSQSLCLTLMYVVLTLMAAEPDARLDMMPCSR